MARPVKVDCPAKVNLYLDVVGRRPDGYHDLVTVMAPVSLFDTISVEPAGRRDELRVDPPGAAPSGPDNTVLRALRALRTARKVPPLRIRLAKRIPPGAGLGGGSSDAAGLLRAADRKFSLGLTVAESEALLARIGSDTAFFAGGATALCTGRGERVFPIAKPPALDLVVVCPDEPNPTAEVFMRFNRSLTGDPSEVIFFLRVLAGGDVDRIGRALRNALEPAAFAYRPALRGVVRALRAAGLAGARMTGSGSGFFGLARGPADRDRAARRLDGRVFRVRTL